MKSKVTFISLLFFCLFKTLLGQTAGFLGNKNQINLSLTDVFDETFRMDYYRFISKHTALAVEGSFQSANNYPLYQTISSDNIVGSASGQSYRYGVGFMFNSPLTGMALPLGHYVIIGISRYSSIGYHEKIDSIPNSSFNYGNKGTTFKITLGREMYLKNNFVLDFSIAFGVNYGSISGISENNNRTPLDILPDNSFFVLIPYKFIGNSNSQYYSIYFIPFIKLGYLF